MQRAAGQRERRRCRFGAVTPLNLNDTLRNESRRLSLESNGESNSHGLSGISFEPWVPLYRDHPHRIPEVPERDFRQL